MKRWMIMILSLVLAVGCATRNEPAGREAGAAAEAFFPILPWGPLHGWKGEFPERKNGLESIAECGFTLAGFVTPRDLPRCEALGLKALVVPDRPNLSVWTKEWKKLAPDEIDARVKALVEEAGDSPAILGYYLTDEPGTSAFAALGRAVAAVKQYAPGKLAYINLYPGYATIGAPNLSQLEAGSFTEYLERYVAEVKPQFISYDNYQVQYSQDLRDAKRAASYWRDLMEVRRVAQAAGLPFWNIVSSNQIRPVTPPPSPANLRLQAYTTLAAGGRGVSWFTYYAGAYGYAPVEDDGERGTTWGYLREVNREIQALGPRMNGLKSTGVYFTAPAPAAGLPALPGRVVESVQSETPLMIGEFEDAAGNPCVMLVNLSLERSARVEPRRGGRRIGGVVFSAWDGRPRPIDEKHGLWLTPGAGVLLRAQETPTAF